MKESSVLGVSFTFPGPLSRCNSLENLVCRIGNERAGSNPLVPQAESERAGKPATSNQRLQHDQTTRLVE